MRRQNSCGIAVDLLEQEAWIQHANAVWTDTRIGQQLAAHFCAGHESQVKEPIVCPGMRYARLIGAHANQARALAFAVHAFYDAHGKRTGVRVVAAMADDGIWLPRTDHPRNGGNTGQMQAVAKGYGGGWQAARSRQFSDAAVAAAQQMSRWTATPRAGPWPAMRGNPPPPASTPSGPSAESSRFLPEPLYPALIYPAMHKP